MSELPPSPPAKPKFLLGLLLIFTLLAAAIVLVLLMPVRDPQEGKPQGIHLRNGRMEPHAEQCLHRMQMLALAMHNYHDVHASFPPAYTVDAEGRPLHSWRVLLLPFLEQTAVFDMIRHDEPWDSDYNRQFHGRVMDVFECPNNPMVGGSAYSAVVGPGTIFEIRDKALSMGDISDGTSNTIMFVERAVPLKCWMDPTQEITLDEAKKGINVSPNGIGSAHPGGAMIAVCDGSVRWFEDSTDPGTLEALLIRNDGRAVYMP